MMDGIEQSPDFGNMTFAPNQCSTVAFSKETARLASTPFVPHAVEDMFSMPPLSTIKPDNMQNNQTEITQIGSNLTLDENKTPENNHTPPESFGSSRTNTKDLRYVHK